MDNSTLHHFQKYPQVVWTLLNIRSHMEDEKYDFPIAIVGGTGNGKTDFSLHLTELWYRVIRGQNMDASYIRHIQNTREGWICNFKNIKELDINSNDEGADGVTSKEGMSRFGRDLSKLYNVFRKKLFLTPILLPDWFELPLYFRKRVRGCFYINKKGMFKYYTMEGLKWINALNENKEYKKMEVTSPFFSGVFPRYTGILREPYDTMSHGSADKLLDEMIRDIKYKNFDTITTHYKEVSEMINEKVKASDIAKIIGISTRDISKIRAKMKEETEKANI